MTLQQAFEVAVQHHQAGRLNEAESIYRQILAVEPRHADALHLLGVVAHQVGKNDAAVDFIRQAIAIQPGLPGAHNNLGEAHRVAGQLDEAIAAYRHAIALQPDRPAARCNLGIALHAKGHLEDAIAAFRQAIGLRPDYPEAYNNLGIALRDKGQLDEAIAACRRAITLRPNYPEAQSNLGNALQDKGQLDEAISAFRQAIALKPDLPLAHYNLGNALTDMGQLDEAFTAYRQAIELKPDFAEAHNNLGNALKDMGRLGKAIAALHQAIALKPDLPEAHSNLVFCMNYHPGFEARAIAAEHRRWNQVHAEPLRRFIQSHANDRAPDRRLRVGYVSADFRVHASAFFLVPLLERHDPREVEVFCYAQTACPDAITHRFRALANHWRNTVGVTDEAVAERIRADRIDVLVDLKLHTEKNRLLVFAQKPAPVQVTWLGFPGSTGMSTIDFRLSDPYLDPPGLDESIYSERTVRLAHTFWCYDPLEGRDLPVGDLPAQTKGYVTFGCLNNFCKVNDTVLGLWSRVLEALPSSRLLLLAPEGSARGRTLDLFAREGIDTGRIEFVSRQPRREYLELYHRIDISLDTLPYNGHTTSLDSLWMGVPVLTLVGQTIVGRAGFSQMMNMGLPEWIAASPEEYVKIAVELAGDLPRLAELRATLRERMEASPLMDAAGFAREMEAAFREMWRTWCEKPESCPCPK